MRILKVGIDVMIAAVVLFGLFLAFPSIAGIQAYAVTSGSMEPAIHTGDMVYVRRQRFEQIMEGDILTFTINDGKMIVTHRVLEKSDLDQSFLTQGDANGQPDGKRVGYEDVLGTVWAVIPWMGYAAAVLGNIWGKLLLMAFMGWLFAMEAIVIDFRRIKKREELTVIEN